MPFPPSFDHAWDITQPPDTQLANLLGQDIRNLKDDIMQRMSLLSGTLANRPSPETLNATWGGAGFGLIYLATDTGQTFQWNGTTWIQISGLLNVQGPGVAFIGNGGLQSIFSYILPANTIPSSRGLRITCNGSHSAGANSNVYNLTLNGVQIGGTSIGSASFVDFQTVILNTGAASGAYWQSISTGIFGPGTGVVGGLNWAANQTLSYNSTNMPNTDQITPNLFVVEFV